jgi:hypothetical protein
MYIADSHPPEDLNYAKNDVTVDISEISQPILYYLLYLYGIEHTVTLRSPKHIYVYLNMLRLNP